MPSHGRAVLHGVQGIAVAARERRAGFEEALKAASIALPRSFIAEGDYTVESGLVAAEPLLEFTPRPTAIFSSTDTMAAGMMHAARQRGILADLSIIGFDDTPVAAHVWPPLTTVRWPSVSMGRSAALKLIAGSEDGEEAVEEPSMFLSTLIKRGSVGGPRE